MSQSDNKSIALRVNRACPTGHNQGIYLLLYLFFATVINPLFCESISSAPFTAQSLISNQTHHFEFSSKTEKNISHLFVFLSARCPCSRSYSQQIEILAKKLKKKGIETVGIHSNFEETSQRDQDYFKKLNYSFPILQDQSQTLLNKFGATHTPHAFLIRKNGDIAYHGAIGSSRKFNPEEITFIEKIIEERIKQPHVLRFQPPLGCSIERI